MGHKRIEVADCFEENDVNNQASAQNNKGEAIPLAAVQGYTDLQALNAEKKIAQGQLEKTELMAQRIVKSVRDAEACIVGSGKSLCEQLSAQSDSCVSRLNSCSDATTKKFENEYNKICDDTIAQLKHEASGLVKIMTRSATCVPVPHCVFWGVVVIFAIVLAALLSFACINYFTLHSKEVWLILTITTFFICSAIWSMLHYYAKDKD